MLFEWSDHSHVTFAQWQTGEPSHATNLQEDCVLIRGKVTPRTVQTQKRLIKCCWWFEWPSGPYRTGGGLTTCVRNRMDTSVRRRPPLNQVKAPKRRPTQDASLWVMQFPLNGGCNYITKPLSDLVSQFVFIISRARSGFLLIATTLDLRKKLLVTQSGHAQRLVLTWWMWLIGKIFSYFSNRNELTHIFKVFKVK